MLYDNESHFHWTVIEAVISLKLNRFPKKKYSIIWQKSFYWKAENLVRRTSQLNQFGLILGWPTRYYLVQ